MLAAGDFSASLLDLRCATFFQWREPCLAYLFSATGAPAAFSDFDDFELAASFALAAACDGPAKHTNSPVASINAARPLALIIMWNLPICPPPEAKGDPKACPQRGGIRESSGESGRKRGSNALRVQQFEMLHPRDLLNRRSECQPDRTML